MTRVEASGNLLPFLRWAGSKRQILPILEKFWRPDYCRYVEPFVGSASLFFRIKPKKALIGDINRSLILTYQMVRRSPRRVHAILSRFPRNRDEYNRLRKLDVHDHTSAFKAARFIYLNRHCFNGLYRTNLAGQFNVPYGKQGAGPIPSEDHLVMVARRLRYTKIIAGDFENVLALTRRGDFVYMDPPYTVGSRRVFRQYAPQSFIAKDVERLHRRMQWLADKKIDFLVSYVDSPEADTLRAGFYSRDIVVRRNIAGFTDRRTTVTEKLISNIRLSSRA